MKKTEYHHGNLRQALIEAGIELMNEVGEDGVSLRKVATRCGVSQAAPYAHFESKADMLNAMQEHVTEQMMQVLEAAVAEKEVSAYENMLRLGEAYVNFFMDHPAYFKFICYSPQVKFRLVWEEEKEVYPPYGLFRRCADACLREIGQPEETKLYCLVNLWATVQGIACLATQPNVEYAGDWKTDLRRILTNGREM